MELDAFHHIRCFTSRLASSTKSLREAAKDTAPTLTKFEASEAFQPITNRVNNLERDVAMTKQRLMGTVDAEVPDATQVFKAGSDLVAGQSHAVSLIMAALKEYGYCPPTAKPTAAPVEEAAEPAPPTPTPDDAVSPPEVSSPPVVGRSPEQPRTPILEPVAAIPPEPAAVMSPQTPPDTLPVNLKGLEDDEEPSPCMADFGISAATQAELARKAPPKLAEPVAAARSFTPRAADVEAYDALTPSSELSFQSSPATPRGMLTTAVTPATSRAGLTVTEVTPQSPTLPRTLMTEFSAPTPSRR